MEFYHDKLKDDVVTRKRWLQDALNACDTHSHGSDILWEVAEVIEANFKTTPYVSWVGRHGITTNLPTMTVEEYEELFDTIDGVFELYGYTLDLKHNTPSWQNGQEFSYIHTDYGKPPLYVTICPASCKTVPTGKMVPEMKSDCSLIKSD